MAFLRGDIEVVKDKRKELRAKVHIAKIDFKNKIEKFCTGNPRQAWKERKNVDG